MGRRSGAARHRAPSARATSGANPASAPEAGQAGPGSRRPPRGKTQRPMKFWDSSAIVPLVVNDAATPGISALFREDPGQIVWCLTEVEVHSALARRDRDVCLEKEPGATARKSLDEIARSWEEVVVLDTVRSRAIRLLRAHPLRAADALQLAAALVVCDERPEGLPFVSLDACLSDAARKEGFPGLP